MAVIIIRILHQIIIKSTKNPPSTIEVKDRANTTIIEVVIVIDLILHILMIKIDITINEAVALALVEVDTAMKETTIIEVVIINIVVEIVDTNNTKILDQDHLVPRKQLNNNHLPPLEM